MLFTFGLRDLGLWPLDPAQSQIRVPQSHHCMLNLVTLGTMFLTYRVEIVQMLQ